MILDCKSISKKSLSSVKARSIVSRMKGVYPSFSLIRNDKASYHKYYLNKLKKYAKSCDIKLDIIDMFDDNIDESIKTIDKLNADFHTNGILLESFNQTLIDNIVPFKDLEGLSIPNIGSLMVNNELLLPSMVKSIIYILDCEKIKIKNSNILILTDEKNHYINPLTQILRRDGATITIANNSTKNLSSLFYDNNIILIANNKASSIGYDLIEDVNMYNRNNVVHGINKPNTLLLDLNIHDLKNDNIVGNIQYNNVDDIYKYAPLEFITVMPAGEYINLALINILNNVFLCSEIQTSMLKKTMSYIN